MYTDLISSLQALPAAQQGRTVEGPAGLPQPGAHASFCTARAQELSTAWLPSCRCRLALLIVSRVYSSAMVPLMRMLGISILKFRDRVRLGPRQREHPHAHARGQDRAGLAPPNQAEPPQNAQPDGQDEIFAEEAHGEGDASLRCEMQRGGFGHDHQPQSGALRRKGSAAPRESKQDALRGSARAMRGKGVLGSRARRTMAPAAFDQFACSQRGK